MKRVPPGDGRFINRYESTDPEDLKALIANGAIWHAGNNAKQRAVAAILAGIAELPEHVPEYVRAYIEARRAELLRGGVPGDGQVVGAPAPQHATEARDWECPAHGAANLVTLTSRMGRVYRSCTVSECEEFEGGGNPPSAEAAVQDVPC